MLGELVNIPTNTLIEMACTILAGSAVLTADDVAELNQIRCELQRRIHEDLNSRYAFTKQRAAAAS